MKRKKKNELVKVKLEDGTAKYFSSWNKAGNLLGIAPVSAKWAADHHNAVATNNGICTIELIDGSEIMWKEIDNA